MTEIDTSREAVERFTNAGMTPSETGTWVFYADYAALLARAEAAEAAARTAWNDAIKAAAQFIDGYRGDVRVALYDERAQACDDLCVTLSTSIRALMKGDPQ